MSSSVMLVGRGLVRVAVLGPHVLVELEPDVGELVGRVVSIGDGLGAGDALVLVVELDLDLVVRALLPVLVSGSPRGGAVDVRRPQLVVELPELVFRSLARDLTEGR